MFYTSGPNCSIAIKHSAIVQWSSMWDSESRDPGSNPGSAIFLLIKSLIILNFYKNSFKNKIFFNSIFRIVLNHYFL